MTNKRRMWTEEEIDARCEAKMQSALATVNSKLDFLGDRMVDMLGNIGDPSVPVSAQRPGILQDIRTENAEHAEQGRETDRKLTEFIQTTGVELAGLHTGQNTLERGQLAQKLSTNRIARMLGSAMRWIWRMSDTEKVPWARTVGAGSVLTAVLVKFLTWVWPYVHTSAVYVFRWWTHSGR